MAEAPQEHPLALERVGAVARLRLDRPALHNAFDAGLISALTAALGRLAYDPEVRVVVLEGSGASFSAGADLNWMRGMASASEAENRDDALALAHLMRTLDELPKPTIARVQGAALGGGTGLAAACDMVVAADNAQFSTSEVKFGIIPAVISPYVLRAIGPRHALRYFQTAEKFSAAEAKAIGLVSELVTLDELDAGVAKLVQSLLTGGPLAQQAAKELIAAISGRQIDAAVGEETALRIARQRAGAEAREGITAFLHKRPAAWQT